MNYSLPVPPHAHVYFVFLLLCLFLHLPLNNLYLQRQCVSLHHHQNLWISSSPNILYPLTVFFSKPPPLQKIHLDLSYRPIWVLGCRRGELCINRYVHLYVQIKVESNKYSKNYINRGDTTKNHANVMTLCIPNKS